MDKQRLYGSNDILLNSCKYLPLEVIALAGINNLETLQGLYSWLRTFPKNARAVLPAGMLEETFEMIEEKYATNFTPLPKRGYGAFPPDELKDQQKNL